MARSQMHLPKMTRQIPPPIAVTPANSQFEREAHQMAQFVAQHHDQSQNQEAQPPSQRLPKFRFSNPPQAMPTVQLHQYANQSEGPTAPTKRDLAKSKGRALAATVRQPIEQAMGVDFSQVRVHDNSQADRLNKAVDARAFTTGRDIYFRRNQYRPETKQGQKLLAHELTHVVQQQNHTGNATIQRWPLVVKNERIENLQTLEQNLETEGEASRVREILNALVENTTINVDRAQAWIRVDNALQAVRTAPNQWSNNAALWQYSLGKAATWTDHMQEMVRAEPIQQIHPQNPMDVPKFKLPKQWKVPKKVHSVLASVIQELAQGASFEEQITYHFLTSKQFLPTIMFSSQLDYWAAGKNKAEVQFRLMQGSIATVTSTLTPTTEGGNAQEGKFDIVIINDGFTDNHNKLQGQGTFQAYLDYRNNGHQGASVQDWLYDKHGVEWKARAKGPSRDRLKRLLIHEATHARYRDYDMMAKAKAVGEFEKGVARFLTEFRAYLAGKDWQPPGNIVASMGIGLSPKGDSVGADARRATAIGLIEHIYKAEPEVKAAYNSDKARFRKAVVKLLQSFIQQSKLDIDGAMQAI